jgi:Recombination endonuclease VII
MPRKDLEQHQQYMREYREKHRQHLNELRTAARHKFRAENPLPPKPDRQQKTKEQHAAEMRLWRARNADRYRAWHREYRSKNRDKINDQKQARQRKDWLAGKYGITLDQWNAMLIEQAGRCEICADPFAGKNDPAVDHDHATGVVRKLLCIQCNTGLGYFKESPQRLQLAIEYLRRHGKE